MRSPVLFLIFNRPDLTKATFECIRQARPPRLYIAADGPREGRDGEDALCQKAREAATQVDWPCEVKKLFRKRNLGCGRAVSSAITWFFQCEPEGVIIEDDLAIHPDFFPFCDEMLERYRENENVMHICGNNFHFGLPRGSASYFFSCFNHIWGWASWARVWQKYDSNMTGLYSRMPGILAELFRSPTTVKTWMNIFSRTKAGEIDTWDYQLTYSIWMHKGLTVYPNVNLICNTGFSAEATHTKNIDSIYAHMPTEAIMENNGLRHPTEIQRNAKADEWGSSLLLTRDPLPMLMQEALYRLETGTPDGVLGIVRVLRAMHGDSDQLLQLETLALLQKDIRSEALAAATRWLEVAPLSDEAKNLILTIKDPLQAYMNDSAPATRAADESVKACIPLLKFCINNKLPVKIELGAGVKRTGWITIDQYGDVDIQCDIVKVGIPFPDNSVDMIYSQHFLEHLSYPTPMVDILLECKRVLKSGSIFSICVPDVSIYINAYLNRHTINEGVLKNIDFWKPGFNYNSPLDYINYMAYMGGHHKHMFDLENLIAILTNAGFVDVRERSFDENLDKKERRMESVYVECST